MAIIPGHQQALAPKPVSSTSSIDTTLSGYNETGTDHNRQHPITTQQPLHTVMHRPDPSHNSPPSHNAPPTHTPNPVIVSSEAMSQGPATNISHDQVHISPSSGVVVPSAAIPNTNTVPEFLYQLTKMLTDNNRDIIEWSNGKIEVHNPQKLQTQVLNRYFRHSKFASFQRQLNYFGFRKLAGKGKMAPCSYVNDATTKDLGSLLMIKRKVGNEPKVKLPKKRERADSSSQETPPDNLPIPPVNPVLANILYRSSEAQDSSAPSNPPGNGHLPPNQSQQEIARVAVGRGIRHNFSHSSAIKPAPLPARPPATAEAPQTTGEPETSDGGAPVVQANLSALKNNFQIAASANNPSAGENSSDPTAPSDYVPGSMRRDDSLVDLAMIPLMDDGNDAMDYFSSSGLSFIDFPWQDPSAPPGSG